ncbi:methyltransferase domain-containing protein [Actinoplanes sp. LDG1-06]|uniref:Methyltransferase domain-containing protein n=1 Tax=Paractinoplanes ovalisporus TaxID=2810368 RepID=A0ABS2AGW7_9ACTN|nr:methyltransferase domain-containing protein [Actinoplanes ovalisporus]MBM2618486.1 methyltransferase domain-containing protein [Actinoplanes ovalisporus]
MGSDEWTRWLLERRDGGNAELRAQHAFSLEVFRDQVLDRAALAPDDTVLDVGAGTGLIAFGALERLGPDGHVIFSDVSDAGLEECRQRAGNDKRCSFVHAAAEDLSMIPDSSVDVVTTRSVLIYCDHKSAAFREFFRVLKPGGRLSIFEPVNRFLLEHRPDSLFGLRDPEVADLLAKVVAVYRDGARRGENPMTDFDERDLLRWAAEAGFDGVEVDYRAQLDVPAEPIGDWEARKAISPNPLAPTYGEAMTAALSEEEYRRLDTRMTQLAQSGTPTRRTLATAYLRALHP